MKRCFEDLCASMDILGVPKDSKWRGLILYMRSLKYHDSLSLEKRDEIQKLVQQVLCTKDFSDEAFDALVNNNERILNDQWRLKLTEALHETAQLIKQFQDLLERRKDDVHDLGAMTLETIQTEQPLERMVVEIKAGFQRIESVLQKDLESIIAMGMLDELTKLNNRRALDCFLGQALPDALSELTPLSLVFIDIDHFKQFNDQYGHLVGDQALVTVAALLRSFVEYQAEHGRDQLYPARFGGEEFALVLPEISGEDAMVLAEIIRKRIENYNFLVRDINGDVLASGVKIQVSAGVAELHADCGQNPNVPQLIDAADKALYKAKNRGRNRVERFTKQ